MNPANLFIILPAYNERTTIGALVDRLKIFGYKNIVVVDDGSEDNTGELAKMSGATVLRHLINRGQGAAVQTGLEYARKMDAEYVLTMDSDGQFVVNDIKILTEAAGKGEADIILGNRFAPALSEINDIPFWRRLYNITANIVTWAFSGFWLKDSQTGFRLLGPKALKLISLRTDGYEFCTEMIRLANCYGLTIKEVPVQVLYFRDSRAPRGQGFVKGIETLFKLILESFFR